MLLLLFHHPVMSNSLLYQGQLPTRHPCPSPSPGVCPSSRSLHCWCHPAISSYDALFSFCPQSFPASGTFPMSCLFASDDQNPGASASTSALPVNIQGWSHLKLFRSLLQHHSLKASILWHSAFFMVQLSQPYVTTGKTIALTTQTFVGRALSLFATHCLDLSLLFCQEAIVFGFLGCSHHPQWFWSPRRGNLSLLPPFPLLFAM